VTKLRDFKAIFIASSFIALTCFLILPLYAQDAGDPQPDEGAAEVQQDQIINEESEEPQKSASAEIDLPAVFELKDFPSDEGGVFLITWPLSDKEKELLAERDKLTNEKGRVDKRLVPLTSKMMSLEKQLDALEEDSPKRAGLLKKLEPINRKRDGVLNELEQINGKLDAIADFTSSYTYRIYQTLNPEDVIDGNIRHIEADEEAEIEVNYEDFEPLSDTLATVRTHFWPSRFDADFHAYSKEFPNIPIYEKNQLENGKLIKAEDGKYLYEFTFSFKSRMIRIAEKKFIKEQAKEPDKIQDVNLSLDIDGFRRDGIIKSISLENGSLTLELPKNIGQIIPSALIPRFKTNGEPEEYPDFKKMHYFQLAAVDDSGNVKYIGTAQNLVSTSNAFDILGINNVFISFLYCMIVLLFISQAKRGKELFIRKIAGLDAVDEAIGRATEMGKPILYLTGLDSLSNVSTIAAINILGQVAKKVADYDSKIINPNRDPVVMSVCQEVVKEAYMDAGRPDAYNPDNIFFVTDDQFSFTAAVDGIMVREKPATNIFMGYYYAESLILAETGASTGAIQIAGTDSLAQLPFFITTCDYTLIGEELYAASAYLAREPLLLGSLKGQDVGKMFLMVMLVIGVIWVTILGMKYVDIPIYLNHISNVFAAK